MRTSSKCIPRAARFPHEAALGVRVPVCAALFVCGIVGCAPRMNEARTLELASGEVVSLSIPASTADQVLTVVVDSGQAPVSIHIFLRKDEEEMERMLTLQKPAKQILASADDVSTIELNASIPSNEEAVVRISGPDQQPATVQLTLRKR